MNLIHGRYPYLTETIMFNNVDDVPSREGMWRPGAAIFSTFMKKNFSTGWRNGSEVIVEVTKYLCMSR